MWMSAVVVFATAVLTAAAATADQARPRNDQARSHKWWQADRFKADLGLTPQQSAAIEEVFQASLPRLRAAKKALDREEAELSTLIGAEQADESRVFTQIDRVEASRSELSKTRTLMLFRMRRILTPEQRVKLNTLHAQRERDGSRDRR